MHHVGGAPNQAFCAPCAGPLSGVGSPSLDEKGPLAQAVGTGGSRAKGSHGNGLDGVTLPAPQAGSQVCGKRKRWAGWGQWAGAGEERWKDWEGQEE